MNLKQPKAKFLPHQNKCPRIENYPKDNGFLDFRADRMDIEGPWNWKNLLSVELRDLLQKIFQFQKQTWQTLREQGSHLVEVSQLITPAQKRLIEITQDDVDALFSLRISGEKRIWGIKDTNIFWLLWWDPKHLICPSLKKHT